jgi:glycosyltransferase involved in cell wall biosynthesis
VTRRRLLGLTTSPLPVPGQITDGPGFRMWNLLQEVAKYHDVRVLSLYESVHLRTERAGEISSGGITVEFPSHRPGAATRRIKELRPDVLYLPWSSSGFLGRVNQRVPTILDYVGPGLMETMAHAGRVPVPQLRLKLASFWYGDLFLTTTARERFYLIGLLAASGRLSRGVVDPEDPLVQVVRMTPPSAPPVGTARVRAAASDPLVVLLAGAFLPWYDYALVARAWAELPPGSREKVRLRVVGGNPRMPEVARWARDALTGVAGVEFSGTVPFDERERLYLAADAGLALPSARIEEELSARTRVLDYLWAGLPLLSEGNDEYSNAVIAGGAGFRFAHRPTSLASLLDRLCSDPSLVRSARAKAPEVVRASFDVAREAAPVLEFLERPTLTARNPRLGPSVQMTGLWMADVAHSFRRRSR